MKENNLLFADFWGITPRSYSFSAIITMKQTYFLVKILCLFFSKKERVFPPYENVGKNSAQGF